MSEQKVAGPSVTHPSSLAPSPLAAGEEYASVTQILECEDLPHATLHIPHWRIRGKPAAIRVRALSLDERERVQLEKTTADQYCLTWHLGCVSPTFTVEQAQALKRKNPIAVESAVSFIWNLSALNQEWIDHVVQAQTGADAAPAASDDRAAADPESAARVRRVA